MSFLLPFYYTAYKYTKPSINCFHVNKIIVDMEIISPYNKLVSMETNNIIRSDT